MTSYSAYRKDALAIVKALKDAGRLEDVMNNPQEVRRAHNQGEQTMDRHDGNGHGAHANDVQGDASPQVGLGTHQRTWGSGCFLSLCGGGDLHHRLAPVVALALLLFIFIMGLYGGKW